MTSLWSEVDSLQSYLELGSLWNSKTHTLRNRWKKLHVWIRSLPSRRSLLSKDPDWRIPTVKSNLQDLPCVKSHGDILHNDLTPAHLSALSPVHASNYSGYAASLSPLGMAPPCWPPRPPLMQLSEMPSYTSFLPATLPLGKFLLQDPAQGPHTPESISWLLSAWGEWGAHLCAPITSGDKLHPSAHHAALRAHVCYSHYVIIFACSSSQWFIQLVLEKIPNSRSQKSCPNLKPKCTKNKAGISVIPITLIERLKENGECHWIQTEPTFQVATHTQTHIHT